MATPLRVRFSEPRHGSLGIELVTDEARVDTSLSYAAGDNLAELVLAVHRALDGWPHAEAEFLEGAPGFHFAFDRVHKDTTRLTVTRFPEYLRRSSRPGEVLLEATGPTEAICKAFWRGFRELQGRVDAREFEQAWRHPFPSTEVDALGARLTGPTS